MRVDPTSPSEVIASEQMAVFGMDTEGRQISPGPSVRSTTWGPLASRTPTGDPFAISVSSKLPPVQSNAVIEAGP
jgi:hypothetical protein